MWDTTDAKADLGALRETSSGRRRLSTRVERARSKMIFVCAIERIAREWTSRWECECFCFTCGIERWNAAEN